MPKCPICNQPMRHTRLSGYECGNSSHRQRVNDIMLRWLNYPSGSVDQFVKTFPESEREIVYRVLDDDGWLR